MKGDIGEQFPRAAGGAIIAAAATEDHGGTEREGRVEANHQTQGGDRSRVDDGGKRSECYKGRVLR